MRRAFLYSVLLVYASACGLTAKGTGPADGGGDEVDAAADVTTDAGADALVEAEVEAAPCLVTVDDPFTATMFDPSRWLTTANPANAALGFPRPDFGGGTPTAKLVGDTQQFVRAAIWHPQVLPFAAFDIELDAYAVCNAGPSCGDGIAVTWLEKATPAQLGAADEGATFGIPKNLRGGAVVLDLAMHVDRGESEQPAMMVLDLDGTDPLTPRNWVLGTSTSMPKLQNQGARRIKLSMRAKKVAVSVDGAEVTSGAFANLPDEGTFGITASSGAYNAAFAIGDVRAKFYRCNAP